MKIEKQEKVSEFLEYLKIWLRRNRGKFPYRPYTQKIPHSKNIKIKFANINCIFVTTRDDGECSAWAVYDEDGYDLCDWVGDFDVCTIRDKRGRYYCDLCIERVYYRRKEQLWDEHLKHFLEWSKKNLKPDNYIVFTILEGNSHWARFYSLDKAKEVEQNALDRGDRTLCLPLVKAMSAYKS